MAEQIKRALILAGGGLKVAFQAGVLQVWLDEAGLTFDHADGASGGCFNLAMYCQGMSGKQIADNWRNFDPLSGLNVNFPDVARLAFAPSIFTLDAYRSRVFPSWGLAWDRIARSPRAATFNYFNFSKMKLEVVEPKDMTEDKLAACVSLPMWFPPVIIGGDTCIDAVYNTDANLEEAIRRGADELWIIWTVSEAGKWADGFINNYFQIIEVAANGRLRDVLARIEANNQALANGLPREFGRKIDVKLLRSEVGLNYIFNADRDRFVEAVNDGVQKARAWCQQNGLAFNALPDPEPTANTDPVALSFDEVMKGFVGFGETDFSKGYAAGSTAGTGLTASLSISMNDAAEFLTNPHHEASVSGAITCDNLGGRRPVDKGTFNLLIDTEDPNRKLMTYRLFFSDDRGRKMTLAGYKDVKAGEHFDPWETTTTLYTKILEGAVAMENEGAAVILATGIIRIHLGDFLQELTTFRATGSTAGGRLSILARFGELFLGKLWDVYANRILPVSPF